MSGNLKMTVNVSLCGSIPRSQMNFSSSKRLRQLNVNTTENTVTSKCKSLESPSSSNDDGTTKLKLCLPRQVSCDTINPISPSIIEPPSWAVAAQGDARLEVRFMNWFN